MEQPKFVEGAKPVSIEQEPASLETIPMTVSASESVRYANERSGRPEDAPGAKTSQ
jgi:hypothetical protein